MKNPLYVTGPLGEAFRVEPSDAWPAAVDCYIVRHLLPNNAFWDHYMVAAVDLVDRPGLAPAYKQFPDAEFEFLVAALNPHTGPYTLTRFQERGEAGGIPGMVMTPVNLTRQYGPPRTREDLARLVYLATFGICHDKRFNPEGPAIIAGGRMLAIEPLHTAWRRFWEQSLDATLDHGDQLGGHNA